MESATVIARGAGTTTIVRSDELAARLLQDGIRQKRNAAPAPLPPVARDPQRRARRPDRPRQGLDALRAGVGRVGDAIRWLRGFAGRLPPDTGYVWLIGENGSETAFATNVLATLRDDGHAYDKAVAEGAPEALPLAIELGTVAGQGRFDLAPRRYLSLIRWSDTDDEIRITHRDQALTLDFGPDDMLELARPDHAGAITLRLGAREIALRSDPSPARSGLIDVVL